MKIKYSLSSGEINAAGPMPDLKSGPGEVVEDYLGPESPDALIGKIRAGKDSIRDKTKPEKDASEKDEKDLRKARAKALKDAGITKEVFEAIFRTRPEDFDL